MPDTRTCRCNGAERNRRRIAKSDPRAIEPLMAPNDDGERVCAFCWEVIE